MQLVDVVDDRAAEESAVKAVRRGHSRVPRVVRRTKLGAGWACDSVCETASTLHDGGKAPLPSGKSTRNAELGALSSYASNSPHRSLTDVL